MTLRWVLIRLNGFVLSALFLGIMLSGCQPSSAPRTSRVERPQFEKISWWTFRADPLLRPKHQNQQTRTTNANRNLFAFGQPPRPKPQPRPVQSQKPPEEIIAKVPNPAPPPKPAHPPQLDRYRLKGVVLHENGTPKFAVLADDNEILVALEHQELPGGIRVRHIEWNRVVLETRDGRFSRTLTINEPGPHEGG